MQAHQSCKAHREGADWHASAGERAKALVTAVARARHERTEVARDAAVLVLHVAFGGAPKDILEDVEEGLLYAPQDEFKRLAEDLMEKAYPGSGIEWTGDYPPLERPGRSPSG